MTHPTENGRKAAILVASLDTESVAAVFATLSSDEAEQLRQAVAALAAIDADEQQAIVSEFLGCGSPRLTDSAGGVELDDDLARRLAAFERFPVSTTAIESDRPAASPSELIGVEAGALYRCLAGEHFQTVAVVLAQLPPNQAAALLRHWPSDQQSDILERVAGLTSTDREFWREIEQELLARLRADAESAATSRRSVATVAAILEAADEPVRLAWRDRCGARPGTSTSEPESPVESAVGSSRWRPAQIEADEVATSQLSSGHRPDELCDGVSSDAGPEGAAAYVWDDFRQLDDESLAAIFAAAPLECVRLALAGAETALVERLRRHLGPRAARTLDRQLQQLGTVRLSDIAEAQRRLASLAHRLRFPISTPATDRARSTDGTPWRRRDSS